MSDVLRPDVFDPAAMSAGESRAKLFKRALTAGGAVLAGGVVVGGLPRPAESAPSPAQDAEIFNLALLCEYMESAFFTEASVSGKLTGELLEFTEIVRGHERAHVAFLRDALGNKARKRPTFDFGNATQDPAAFTAAAVALQDLMVAAYNGQAANLTTGALESRRQDRLGRGSPRRLDPRDRRQESRSRRGRGSEDRRSGHCCRQQDEVPEVGLADAKPAHL